jgi:hypothetical protein
MEKLNEKSVFPGNSSRVGRGLCQTASDLDGSGTCGRSKGRCYCPRRAGCVAPSKHSAGVFTHYESKFCDAEPVRPAPDDTGLALGEIWRSLHTVTTVYGKTDHLVPYVGGCTVALAVSVPGLFLVAS